MYGPNIVVHQFLHILDAETCELTDVRPSVACNVFVQGVRKREAGATGSSALLVFRALLEMHVQALS